MSPNKTTRLFLLGGFLAMIILTIVLGVGAIQIGTNLIELNAKFFDHPFTVSNTVRDIRRDVVDIHHAMQGVLSAREPGDIDRALQTIETIEAAARGRFDIVAERFLGNKNEVDAARRAFDDWRSIRAEVAGLVRAGRRDDAVLVQTGNEPDHMAKINRRLDGLIEFAHNKAAEFRAESDATHHQNMAILFGLIAVVVTTGGVIAGFVFVMVGRVERDLAQREELYRQAQKMEAVGQLTGGLAHDLNNVLSIISMNVGMLQTMVGAMPQAVRHIDLLLKGADRAAGLTRRLLDFARTRAKEVKRVSVNDFVGGMESLIKKSLTPAISIEVVLSDDPWAVDVDPADLEAALLNLALNARDAMPDGGTLVLETANKVIDQHYVRRNPGSSIGDFVMIAISDNGSGMTPEVAARAFDPFFTTKEVGRGTGLGLSMVYGFVKRSGGHVKIYSEIGEGTTVRLYLPRGRGPLDGSDPLVPDLKQLPVGEETILVVDDEPDLVEAAEMFLRSLGYRTISANDGRAALDILERDSSIDLVFSDVVMPGGIDGYQLAIKALKFRPSLPFLLTSGFTRKREEFVNGERRIAADLAKTLLHKPYNVAELAFAVRGALDAPRR